MLLRWPFRRTPPGLSPFAAQRLERWRSLREPDGDRPAGAGRWVVVDVETSGLDATRDELISVGALAVVDGVADMADSFEVVLHQRTASADANIEIHGIGGGEQAGGEDPREALAAFLDFVRKDPLVAFHAPFDAEVLRRALLQHLRVDFRPAWLDLAEVAPLAWPKYASRLSGLDDWLEAFAIPIQFRHRAIADCLASAQLFLMVLDQCPSLGATTARELVALSGGRFR
jgi:DNA polymerase-3 subunit epsilon